jgi:hypothetical protein
MSTTKTKTPKPETKPKHSFDAIRQLGLKAQGLATDNQAALGDRVSAAFLQQLGSDLTTLGGTLPTVITTRGESIQLTAEQAAALARGYQLVRGVRTAVKGQKPGKDVLLAYSVGQRVSPVLVKDVKAALQTIVDRATAEPAEAASFGIVAADLTAMQTAVADIDAAEKASTGARVSAPKTTSQRNATARRILAAVKTIAGAGLRTFVDDPTTSAEFEALIKKAK